MRSKPQTFVGPARFILSISIGLAWMLLVSQVSAQGESSQASDSASAHSPVELPEARKEPRPKQLKGVGIEEKLGQTVPLDLQFINTDAKRVRLGDYFQGDKPVVLQLGYLHCPQLCPMVMQGMAKSMEQIDWTPSEQYEVLTVSIDPKDSPIEAKKKQQEMVRGLDKPGSENGWHFLVGDQPQIDALAEAVGFKFNELDRRRQFAHSAAIMILSPDGKITRYLKGIRYPAQTMRLSLVDASEGSVGSIIDKALLFCCKFDTKKTKYVATAESMMTAGGAVTLVILGSVLGLLLLRDRKRRREDGADDGDGDDDQGGIATANAPRMRTT